MYEKILTAISLIYVNGTEIIVDAGIKLATVNIAQ